MDEVAECERSRIDAFEVQVFLLEFGSLVFSSRSDVACFRTEKEVGDELSTVDLILFQRCQ
jgi:hypothetical protein